MNQNNHAESEPNRYSPDAASAQPVKEVVDSERLFLGRRELWILHSGELYRLRVTSRNKLILTK